MNKFDVFSNKFSQDIFLQKYSMNGKETWSDTCKRVVTAVCGQLLSQEDQEEIYTLMLERKFIPGGRYLYSSGRPMHQVNNCFDGETRFITKTGAFSLKEKVGQKVEIKNWKNEWEEAEVRSFGVQSLYKMTLSNGDEFLTTENHLWIQPDGSRLTTKNVKRVMLTEGSPEISLDQEGIRHGIVYGDGYKHPKTGYTEIVIVNPKKDEPLVSYFENKEVEIEVGFGAIRKYQTIRKVKAGTKIGLQPKHYKELPTSYSPEYARGFIAGLIATDGHASLGGSVLITCEGMAKAQKIREIAIIGGCVISSIRINSKVSPYDGSPREMCFIYIKPFSAPIILPYHQENMKDRKFYKREIYLDVVDVHPAFDGEVFCVVAPKTNTFTLGNGVLTSNCFLFRAEDSRESWADSMQKTTASLMTGGGIGFDYSNLRPEGAPIKKTGGTSTGPIALMNMINESGRYIMQGGQRRCLPAGTRVQAVNGLIPIENIEIGQEVLTTSGPKKVKAKIYQGEQETVVIKTQNGDLECTRNHRVAVVTSIYGDYEWVEAQHLKENDRLYFGNNLISGTETELPENDFVASDKAYTLKRIVIPKLDEEIAWLIGLIHGDGYVMLKNDNISGSKRHGRVQIACSKNYPEIKDKAVKALSRFGSNVVVKNGDGDLWNVTCSSVELAHYFSFLKKPKEELAVPEFIFNGKPGIRAAYIAGLMDADGCDKSRPIVIAVQIYKNYLKEIQELCSSLGISTRLKLVRKEYGNWKTLYHLTVSTGKQLSRFKSIIGEFGHKCDFKIPEEAQQHSYSLPNTITNSSGKFKHRSVGINTSIERIEKEIGPLPFTPVKVLDIVVGEKKETWDIEVSDKSEFFVNGYLVHNSAIWAGLNWNHGDINKFLYLKDYSQDLLDLKQKDFNFPLPMEGTNISVIYDTEFFIAIENKKHVNHDKAVKLWLDNCKQAFKTAEPGMSFNFMKDNESLRNAPVTAGTRVLTRNGYVSVGDIVNKEVFVWTGQQWVLTTFKKTKDNAALVKVTLSNGRNITCDPEHPFIVKDYIGAGKNKKVKFSRIAASELSEDQKIRSDLPGLTAFDRVNPINLNEYGLGFVFGDGSVINGRGDISYHSESKREAYFLAVEGLNAQHVSLDNRSYFKTDVKSKEELLNKNVLTQDFIAGWFDADGCYTRQLLRLSCSNKDYLIKLQESLDFLGIKSSVRQDGSSSYKLDNKSYTLNVLSESLTTFKALIPTVRLEVELPEGYTPYRESEIRVVSVELLDYQEDVYCCDVGVEEHSFMAEGVIISNCTEVVSEDDSDKCNLGTLWINRFKDKEDFRRGIKYSTKFLMCGGIYSDVPTAKIKEVGGKNNRIGLGLGGIHEWLMVRGNEYIVTPELHKWLSIYEQESNASAFITAKELAVAVPKGIRAIAPTGTIGIIAETTTGIEPLFCKAYKRRYLKDKKWHHQYVVDGTVKRLLESEVAIDKIKDSYDLTFKQRVKFQADVQNYVDMAISSTCNISEWGSEANNEKTLEENGKILLKYAKRLRGFTVYPDKARAGQPLERVSLEEALKQEGIVFEEIETECKGGVCGI